LKHPEANHLVPYLTKPVIPHVTEGVDQHPNLIASASIIFLGSGELAEMPQLLAKLQRPTFDKHPVLLAHRSG
jgi:hypothetical protein